MKRMEAASLAENWLAVADKLADQALALESDPSVNGVGRSRDIAMRLRIREEHALLRAQIYATLAGA